MGFGSFCQAPTCGDFLNMYTPEEWNAAWQIARALPTSWTGKGLYFMGDSLRYKDWFEKAAHDLRGAEILNGVWRRQRFSHAADNGENAKMQGSTL